MSDLRIDVGAGSVSAMLDVAARAQACLVFAHGAGAGMRHPFMDEIATGLAARGVTTLRFQFPFAEAGAKRPDTPRVAQAAVRSAVAVAARRFAELPLFAGGKSFGGRMTSQAQAEAPLVHVRGLVFLGYPLHPAGKPGIARATHLAGLTLPMLFVQGTRDALADPARMETVVAGLGRHATLVSVEDGDHSFHVRRRSGRTDEDALAQALDATAAWIVAVGSER